MDINISTPSHLDVDIVKMQKMVLIFNALESGWTVKKNNNKYVFYKKHLGNKEILLDSYLSRFMKDNLDINKIINNN